MMHTRKEARWYQRNLDIDYEARYGFGGRPRKRNLHERMPWTRDAKIMWEREFWHFTRYAQNSMRQALEQSLGPYRYKVTSNDVRDFIAHHFSGYHGQLSFL